MDNQLYSLKMRASQKLEDTELHISGAEKIIAKDNIINCCEQMIDRAMNHAKGEANLIHIKLESVDANAITHLDALPVTTVQVENATEGMAQMLHFLKEAHLDRAEEILALLETTYSMRGAMLLNVDTMERMEPDPQRGIRATYMDIADANDSRREKNHFKEALVLATKVSHHPNIIGEICISDDPDYVTGYFASKKAGYVRITKLKEMGSPNGGRIFLFRGSRKEAEDCIHYLEQEKVLVHFDACNKPMNKWEAIDQALLRMQEENLYRSMTVMESVQSKQVTIEGERKLLFSSNAYLDLCNDKDMKEAAVAAIMEYGVGSGGSRLTTGTSKVHMELEKVIADYKKRPAAITFNTGYMANVGTISALANKEDIIYSDALNHASIIDGCRLSGAKIVVYKHNDMEDLEKKILEHPGKRGMIVSDGVFSMDGDIVNLPELVRLSNQYQLLSMIDEAHSTGVIGAHGGGVEEYYHMEGAVDVLMGTLSKAIGVEGGYVCGSSQLIAYLINKARSFIFATSMAPMTAAAATAAIRKLMQDSSEVSKLQQNVTFFCQKLRENGVEVTSETAIIPIIIGDEKKAMDVMQELKEQGFFVSAIRYPTVERKRARLRVALMSSHTEEELQKLAVAIGNCVERHGH